MASPSRRHVQQPRGKDQQAEDEEHPHLAQPGERVVHPEQSGAIGQRPVAEQESGEVHGEEAAAVRQRRQAEGHQAERQRHDRVEAAAREGEPGEQVPAAVSDGRRPTAAPTTSCTTISTGIRQPRAAPGVSRFWVSTVVRMTATGSLMPDSTSSVTPTRRLSWSPLPRSTANTAAASVDETTAPSSSASRPSQARGSARRPPAGSRCPLRRRWRGRRPGAAARRTALSGVLSPPSNRMSASASDADPEGELVVVELDAADPLGPGQHPDDAGTAGRWARRSAATRG